VVVRVCARTGVGLRPGEGLRPEVGWWRPWVALHADVEKHSR
jgi:hypothetical protein